MAAVDDLRKLLQLIPGGASIDQKLTDFENYIRNAAHAGALDAVPQIKAEVKATVEPYVLGALALGMGGFLFGLSAHLKMRARS